MSTETMEESPPVVLTGHDRCDQCQAQAFVLAALGADILMFCGHHGNKNTIGLRAAGWSVWDYTHMINKEPSVSTSPE